MIKKEARTFFRSKRAEVTSMQKMKWDDLLLIQFQQVALPPLHAVMSYYPADDKGEADTFLITDFLQFRNPGQLIAYPRIGNDGSMQAIVPNGEEDFAPNSYGIMEPLGEDVVAPDQFDLVIIPLLCYDQKGNRVGYGKGYYDRFLQSCRPDCIKAGISYFEPIEQIEDADEYDVPLDLCITPHKVYVF